MNNTIMKQPKKRKPSEKNRKLPENRQKTIENK
jgi:hypothetical protein